jgi:hypothetical protein
MLAMLALNAISGARAVVPGRGLAVLAPAPGVAVAQVRRAALGEDGQPVPPGDDFTGAFSEMALYVLVRRGGTWWLAAGQNTPIRSTTPDPRHP